MVNRPTVLLSSVLVFTWGWGLTHSTSAKADDNNVVAYRYAAVSKESGFKMNGYFVWGGSVIKVGDRYHLFAERWPEKTQFPDGYRQHAEIVRAEATCPEGPYQFKQVVLGRRKEGKGLWDSAMACNPAVYKIGDRYVLYYIGSDFGSRYRQIGVATAPAVTGPWTRYDKPLDLGIKSDANNPAVYPEPDGSVRMIWRNKELRTYISCAKSVLGPYAVVNDNVWPAGKIQDFFMFKRAGEYVVIADDTSAGTVTGHECRSDWGRKSSWGAHLFSKDGASGWKPCAKPAAYDSTIRWKDGTEFVAVRRERPWFLIENGRITFLFTAVFDGKKTWNQPVPLETPVPVDFAAKGDGTSLDTAAAQSLMPTEPIAEIKAPFSMPQLQRPAIPQRSFDIRDFGAKPGKGQDNTKAIRDAIEACAGKGGGSVIIPAGDWHTGPIHYKSNINLHLENGASVYFLPDARLYLPPVHVRYIGTECMGFSPMLYACHCTNIALTGHGKLYGPGEDGTRKRGWCEWRMSRDKLAKAAGVKRRSPGFYTWEQGESIMEDFAKQVPNITKRNGAGTYAIDPSFFQPIFCENVLVEDIMVVRNGPLWTIHPTFCRNVIVRKVAVFTQGRATDAIDLDSCENALVEYCDIASGDDMVVMKSGQNEDAWRAGKPTRNVVVRYINGMYAHAGGFSIGTELSGDVENVYFHDCIANAPNPVRIKSRPGRGGVVRNIIFERIRAGVPVQQHTDWKFPAIPAYEPAKYLVEIDTNYPQNRKQVAPTKVTAVRDITIRDISATTVNSGIYVIDSKQFSNIRIETVAIGKTLKGPGGVGSGTTLKNYVVGGTPVQPDRTGDSAQEKPYAHQE